MTTKSEPSPSRSVQDRGGPRRAAGDLSLASLAVVMVAGATWQLLALPASYLATAAMVFVGFAVLIWSTVPGGLPGPGLGMANRVTLARATLVLPIAALVARVEPLGPVGYWWVIVLATIAMVLDGVDGRVARRTGTETPFGARFDMELDAALIMVLSVLAWASGKVAVWVLFIGMMRYLFVAAALVWPVLDRELPDSLRRKVVCVLQGVVLLVAIGPIVSPGLATVVVGTGLAALTYSFIVDIVWLVRRDGRDAA
jgi:phosphatidylglycerophosphate synthase